MSPVLQDARVGLLSYRLDRPMGGSGVSEVDLIVAELADADGAQGFGFSYVIAGGGGFVAERCAALAARFLQAKPLHPAPSHWREISNSFNRTGLGPNLVALAALDLALWDLNARRHGLSLAAAMGGKARAVPVYASGGFQPGMDPGAAADVATACVEAGMAGVKPRIAGRPADAALIAAVANAVSGRAWSMADMNEKGDLVRARWVLDLARDHGLLFVEEPLPAADHEGLRSLARHPGGRIATGEHLQAVTTFAELARNGLAAVLQPDLAMVGGMTPSLHIAQMAEALGLQVMPHFLPGLYCHLASAVPSVTMLEDFPLLEPLFDHMPVVENGTVVPGDAAGHGLRLDPGRVPHVNWL